MSNNVVGLGKLNIPGIITTESATAALNILVGVWKEYKVTCEVEKTKRDTVYAWRDTRLQELNNNKKILEQYLEGVFKERATTIHGFFDKLDRGIENGDHQLIDQMVTGILSIARESPLAGAKELISAMYDPDTKVIEI